MIKRLIPLLLLSPLLSAAEFKVEGNAFVLDGSRFRIRSGEIHYPRVPREEWRNRVRMARAPAGSHPVNRRGNQLLAFTEQILHACKWPNQETSVESE